MKLLAIETSTTLGGVAILNDDRLIVESRINVKVTHSERLMSEIDHSLKQAGMKIDDIDVFGISIGPGSFTGLRIGLSTIKGLSYATGRKIVSVPTLEAFAWNIPFSRYQVCPLLDARKKEVYAGIFKWNGNSFERIINEQTIKVKDLVSLITEPTIFLGEGAIIYSVDMQIALGNFFITARPQHMVPSPSNVALLGMKKARSEEFEDPVSLVPMYMRKSEAEIKAGNR